MDKDDKPRLLSLEDWHSLARDRAPDVSRETPGAALIGADGVQRGCCVPLVTQVKAVDEEKRTVRWRISSEKIDRMGDIIKLDGWNLEAFNANPVVLWAHNSRLAPIGRGSDTQIESDGLYSTTEFMTRDISAFADSIFRMVAGGWLKTTSVGMIPLEWSWAEEKDRKMGINFLKQELLEYSVVPIPANPDATLAAKAAGVDLQPIKEWAEQLLDIGSENAIITRKELEGFRALAAKEKQFKAPDKILTDKPQKPSEETSRIRLERQADLAELKIIRARCGLTD